MDILVPLVIFFFFLYVIAFVIRRVFKQVISSENSSGGDSPWKQVLGDLITRIKKEMETAKKKTAESDKKIKTQRKPRPINKQPPQPPEVLWEKSMGTDKPPQQAGRKKTAEIKPAKPQPEVSAPLPSEISESKNLSGKTSVRELRKAVVWSEVLAPPLALRKRDQ